MELLLGGGVNPLARHDMNDDDDDDDEPDDESVARVLFRDDDGEQSNGGGYGDGESYYYNGVDWSSHLTTACRLYHDLETEAASNTTALFVPRYLEVFERLIKVTYYQQNGAIDQFSDQERNFHVLHALVGLSTTTIPRILADMILTKYNHQLAQPDPFHHCLPLHMACSNGNPLMIKILHGYPRAVVNRGGGDYPLHVACRSKHWEWSTGIRELFEAAPDVLLLNTSNGKSANKRALPARASHDVERARGERNGKPD
jgi:hypothetical protein